MNIIRKPFKYNFCYFTIILVVINIVVFLLTGFSSNLEVLLALNPYAFLGYRFWWQPFTYMFVHGNLSHLFCNMLGLLCFGLMVEKRLGSKEFALLYFLSGIICGLVSVAIYILSGTYNVSLIGASGAVFAILLAFAVIFPSARVFVFGIIPLPAPVMVVGYAAIEIIDQVFGLRQGVAHMTHLIGFAVAWLYFVVRFGVNPITVWKNAWR